MCYTLGCMFVKKWFDPRDGWNTQVLAGVYTLRVAIGGSRTELRHVDEAWNVIQLQALQLLQDYNKRMI